MSNYKFIIIVFSVAFGFFTTVLFKVAASDNSGIFTPQNLIEVAERNNGVIDFSVFSERVCVEPPGTGLARAAAERFFPNRRIELLGTERSEGQWYFIYLKSDAVQVQPVDQSMLRWNVDEATIYRDISFCPSFATINLGTSPPEIIKFAR